MTFSATELMVALAISESLRSETSRETIRESDARAASEDPAARSWSTIAASLVMPRIANMLFSRNAPPRIAGMGPMRFRIRPAAAATATEANGRTAAAIRPLRESVSSSPVGSPMNSAARPIHTTG